MGDPPEGDTRDFPEPMGEVPPESSNGPRLPSPHESDPQMQRCGWFNIGCGVAAALAALITATVIGRDSIYRREVLAWAVIGAQGLGALLLLLGGTRILGAATVPALPMAVALRAAGAGGFIAGLPAALLLAETAWRLARIVGSGGLPDSRAWGGWLAAMPFVAVAALPVLAPAVNESAFLRWRRHQADAGTE